MNNTSRVMVVDDNSVISLSLPTGEGWGGARDGIPFTSLAMYYGDDGKTRALCHAVKENNDTAIRMMAERLAKHTPHRGVCLVPMPGHTGKSTQMLILCNYIHDITSIPVIDCLCGKSRQQQYLAKKNGHSLTEQDLGYRQVKSLPPLRTPIIIDAVADTGLNAKAAYHALGNRGEVLTYAVTDNLINQSQQYEQHCAKGIHR